MIPRDLPACLFDLMEGGRERGREGGWVVTALLACFGARGDDNSKFDVRCSMFDVRCSMFDVRCSMFDVRCSMFDVRCSMFDVRCSMFDVRCSMFDDDDDDLLR